MEGSLSKRLKVYIRAIINQIATRTVNNLRLQEKYNFAFDIMFFFSISPNSSFKAKPKYIILIWQSDLVIKI